MKIERKTKSINERKMKNLEVIRIQIAIKKQINFILLFKYFECVLSSFFIRESKESQMTGQIN